MSDLLSTLGTTGTIISGLADLALIDPDKNVGLAPMDGSDSALIFHTIGEEVFNLSSDITDHYVEDNSSIQDHIAKRPEMFTLTGFIGELNNVTPKLLEPLAEIADRLQPLSPYTPVLSKSAIIAYNAAAQAYAVADKVKNAAETIGASLLGIGKAATKQEAAFQKLYSWWDNRVILKVQTPWSVIQRVAIMSIRTTQGDDTRMISNFEVTVKKLRFAQTTTLVGIAQASGRLSNIKTGIQDNGTGAAISDGTSPLKGLS